MSNKEPDLQQKKLTTKDKLRFKKKEAKKLQTAKRARLIIRNLPFTANEENIRELFEKFGEVSEVNLLKKPDGKLVGCGFVQFKLVQKAAKARHHTDGKDFLGRNIEVNFVLSKDVYKNKGKEKVVEEVEIKEEPTDVDLTIVKEEVDEGITDNRNRPVTVIGEIKEEDENLDNEVNEIIDSDVEEGEDDEDSEVSEEDDSDTDDNSSNSTTNEENKNDVKQKIKDDDSSSDESEAKVEDTKPVKPEYSRVSNDVQEGKTVFVKNIPFSVTNADLKECMKQFGPVYYALICIDKLTEHSKGTGFVKFVNIEDAEKCLQAGTELKLHDNILDCHKALERDELSKNSNMKKGEIHKDSRNLYLVKEGVILAGSSAAHGVSASDMAKRLQLEQYKTQILRNLNMYISRYRLIIHNIPPTWNDRKLRMLFQKHAGSSAVIKEARIMRNLKDVDANGTGKSKEHGFVTFSTHEDAVRALRSLNNNPKIFSPNKRPIVAFSIENKVMVKAKEKRLERSRTNNPTCKQYVPKVEENKEKVVNDKKRKFQDDNAEAFAGVTAKPGIKKMRSKYKLQTQAQIHRDNLKKEKHRKKFSKKPLKERQKDFTKQPRQKINHKVETDNFNVLVNNYKKKLYDAKLDVKKNKWYES